MTTSATITVSADLSGTSPRVANSSAVYTDISSAFLAAQKIRRGRTYELVDMDQGAMACDLDNRDRSFDPVNASGPYYPNVKPMVRGQIKVTISATVYKVFTGYALSWPPVWESPDWSQVTVTWADAFVAASLTDLIASWSQEATDVRIGHVLDALGFPAADRVLDAGASLCAAVTFVETDQKKAIDHLRDIERTESGMFFFDGQGRAIFKSRRNLLLAQATTKATFGDTGTDLHYEEAPGDYGDRLIYNSVAIVDSANNATTVTDATSQNAYWPRSLQRQTLLPSGSLEATDAANFFLSAYKDPHFRFQNLTFIASLSDALMTEAVTREIGDRITVKKTAPGGGAQIVQDCIVQSITHVVAPGDPFVWTTTYELSPAVQAQAWIFDTSMFDTSTVFAY